MPDETKKLIAFSFQSYIANTWWTFNDEEWFTVWEGKCRFHSTLDVGYNIELFSLFFWPDLLKMQLEKWSHYQIKGYLSHDIGDDLYICGQTYDHDMPVEESANYILLLYGYWKFTADNEFLKGKYGLIKRLLHYLMTTDKDGDGISDIPGAVRNTVDAGSKTIEGSSGQTYLGIKCLSAYITGKILSRQQKDKEFEKECEEWIKKIITTLTQKSWLGDHFAICIDRNAPDRKGYSMYASNGLFYLLLTDTDIPLPDLFRQDIKSHLKELMKEYGCTHSSSDNSTWISQNIWRDIIGLYLGLNTLKNSDKYWQFQLNHNSRDSGAYTDVYDYKLHTTDLDRYPRGITSIGYIYALGGISVDLVTQTLKISPPVISFKIPLTICANWKIQNIPWISLEEEGQKVRFQIIEFKNLSRFERIHLRIPTLKKPESIQFFSEDNYDIPGIIGKKLLTKKGIHFQLNELAEDKENKLWVTDLELYMKEKSYCPKILDVELGLIIFDV